MKKQTVHLICNAHLDPVWLWQWPEGAAETLSTFRTAAELCEKDGFFIFNHNEVILYEWVREYDSGLFERIQKLVTQGKWHIMGGWYLQPDCNMPSGEAFVRQISEGRKYFKKYFNVEPTTAINFDPFGHTRGLVQILAKTGFDSYLFGRPTHQFLDLPADTFKWVGYDGSSVTATRFSGWYNTKLGQARKILEERIETFKDIKVLALLWGVGNHGGGPSRNDLQQVNEMIAERGDVEIRHSTPEEYFSHVAESGDELPEFADELRQWAVGCYSSQILIKQKYRLLENTYFTVEKMASAAWSNGFIEYPFEELAEVRRDMLEIQFHDILPGTSIKPAEEDALEQIGHALHILSRVKTRCFFALAKGQKLPQEGQIPILVYNPHPYTVKTSVTCEFNLADFKTLETFTDVKVFDQDDAALPSQVKKEYATCHGAEWRKRVVFDAELKPMQMNRFNCRLFEVPAKPEKELKIVDNKIRFKTQSLDITINADTGFVDKYLVEGKSLLKPEAFKPVIIQDDADPWGMMKEKFLNKTDEFRLMTPEKGTRFSGIAGHVIDSVRVIEDGEVRSVVEVLLSCRDSSICMHYILPKKGTLVELDVQVFWNEKDSMLKLSVPLLFKNSVCLGQQAYGRCSLPVDGTESVSHGWVAAVSETDDCGIACIKDSIYASDFHDGQLNITLLRSPAYSAHPGADKDGKMCLFMPDDRFVHRIDQGYRSFSLWFDGGSAGSVLQTIDRKAQLCSEKPYALSFFPDCSCEKPHPPVVIENESILVTALKHSEEGEELVVRLFEPQGKPTTTMMTLPSVAKQFELNFSPFEIKTLSIDIENSRITETDLLERPLAE
ncbi:Mannosylglycerate hydrolase [Limihaloglobus sulfuriphilus]|uniref:Mannosylglycerate hydrolase n=1 Tax=Limihaloglobus sulfuriphilus TaxID=1851148 RepID=A0A1Q2MD57_9BACT|nr:alpha-mannosidase [Limihaloglobus sulfuriphilus]AQQ70247.1 Mannosylglycerate hydrolase [Limihaloglobus sulfuriphilus]